MSQVIVAHLEQFSRKNVTLALATHQELLLAVLQWPATRTKNTESADKQRKLALMEIKRNK